MSALNTKTNQFNIIISLKEHNNIELILNKLDSFVNNYLCNYAYILHDNDYNKEGERKTPHIHLLMYNTIRKRLSTIINEISDFLGISPFAISIDKIVSLEGSIQYLIHKNDIEKWQYDVKEIKTNIDKKEFDLLLNSENGALTFDRLFQIIRHSKNKTEVIEKIGLSYYRIYRPIISDIWNDYKG